PRFVDADGADDTYGTADDDLRLGDGSSSIDAGNNAALPADTYDLDGDGDTDELLPLDVAGESRLIDVPLTPDLVLGSGTIVDMGALEASDPPQSSAVSIVHVDGSAAGAGDGTSWADAFTDLQAALAAARAINDKEAIELWVAAGTYKPAGPGGGTSVSFDLADKLQLYGGFGGGHSIVYPGGETRRGQRDPGRNTTVLNGDLNGDDGPDFANTGENSSTILRLSSYGARVVVDGFTVSGAASYAQNDANGAGLLVTDCAELTVANCVFATNVTFGSIIQFSTPSSSNLSVSNCVFAGNNAYWSSYPYYGSTVHVAGSSAGAQIIGCVFVWNQCAAVSVSGVQARGVDLTNCTFGSGGYEAAIYLMNSAVVRLTNSIVWDAPIDLYGGQLTVDHSDIDGGRNMIREQGGTLQWGEGNIDADPRFVMLDGREQYTSGRVNLRLCADSPCIDAGRDSAMPALWDADGNPRFIDDAQVPDSGEGTPPIVDMGAYEFAGLAITVSPTTVEVPEGQTATFAVALDRDPAGPVEVDVSRISGDADLTLASASTLQFDSGNWATAQTVTLAAAEDGDKAEALAIFRVSSPGLALVDVAAWEVENDVPSPLYVKKGAAGANDGSSWA
ncbi:MAG: right-handed parallel beta-helix repeat-containing protein, partial [Planctomycetes bacterium]|nr:right-handed parallel beta-helix repeat-containing protein [Planctomycetota bacterium]